MDAQTLADVFSAIFAGGSVLFAIHTYKKADLSNNIAKMRASVEQTGASVRDAGALLNERFINQFGVRFSRQLKEIFDDAISPQQLHDILSQKDQFNDNLIMRAFYEAFEQTDAAEKIEIARRDIGQSTTNIRRFNPAIAFFYQRIAIFNVSTVERSYSLGIFKKMVMDDDRRVDYFEPIKKSTSISIAYAAAGEIASQMLAQSSRMMSRKLFSVQKEIFDAISGVLLQMSESDVLELAKTYRQSYADLGAKEEELDTMEQSIKYLFDIFKDLFSPTERDVISLNLGKLHEMFND